MAGPVLSASWVTRQVSIQLDAGLEGQVKVGDPVTITLPDNQTTPGRISYVSSVASTGQNGSTIAVDAVPTDPAATGGLDQAPVNVSITTASVSNVLVVPVDALLALSSGGYAVEEIGAGGTPPPGGGDDRPVRRRRRPGAGQRQRARGRPARRGPGPMSVAADTRAGMFGDRRPPARSGTAMTRCWSLTM